MISDTGTPCSISMFTRGTTSDRPLILFLALLLALERIFLARRGPAYQNGSPFAVFRVVGDVHHLPAVLVSGDERLPHEPEYDAPRCHAENARRGGYLGHRVYRHPASHVTNKLSGWVNVSLVG